MASVTRTEVLVVGAGPTGLVAALQLSQRGARVALIEEEWRPAAHSYALALHGRSLRLLEGLDLVDETIAAGQRLERLTVYEGQTLRASVSLAGSDSRFPFLLALPQSALEDLLARRLAERGTAVRWSHRVAALEQRGDTVVATVQRLEKESAGYAVAHTEWAVADTFAVEAAAVLGADGHRSLVRRALGIAFEEKAPAQTFAVFECALGSAPADELRLVFDARSTNVLWPLPGGRARWSLELERPGEEDERFKSRLATRLGERFFHSLEEERLRELLLERVPWFGAPRDVGWSIEMRFERRLAAELGRGRVWLAGDAAHLTAPAGMQSMNAGLAEAVELARCATLLRSSPADGQQELAEHGRRTAAEWRFLLGLAGGLVRSDGSPLTDASALRLLPCLPALGGELHALAGRLGLEVRGA